MCGRARCTLRPDDFPRACHMNSRPVRHLNMERYRPSYNVAPGFSVPVVRRDDGTDSNGVVLECMKWGLIPSFTKKTEKPDHFKMFNARSESLKEKASFRRLLPKNRCLVAVEGFYEWKKDGSRKQPYYIHFKDGRPLVFAALFDLWKNSEGEVLCTFTIITTSSSSSLEWLHDRMPVILGDKESIDRWLTDSSTSNIDEILKPYGETDLAWYPVTPAMGKLSLDGPECIKEVQVKSDESKSISHFFSKKAVGSQQEQKLERTTVKEEPSETREMKSVKEETGSQAILGKARLKDEPAEASPLRSVEEPGSQLTLEDIGMKVEPVEASPQQHHTEDEEHEGLHEYHLSVTKKDETEAETDASSVSPKAAMKRDYSEFSAKGKPLDKETEKQQSLPVKKKGKGIDDKQPTLFSYFGRS